MYREHYVGILEDLKASVDEVMDLCAEPNTCKVSIEIVISAGDIVTYTVKSEKFPTIVMPTECR